jgi:hypothetical protein
MVSGFPGAAAMADLLHFTAVIGDFRGDQDHARQTTYSPIEWQTTFTATNMLYPRIAYIQQCLAKKEGYQNF